VLAGNSKGRRIKMVKQITRKKNNSHSKISSVISTLLALVCILLTTSCKLFFVDIKKYLKDNTELAAVDKCLTELDSYSITDPNGKQVYCISSNDDFVIKFRLRNPQNYILTPSEPSKYRSTASTEYQTTDPSITVSFDSLFKENVDYLEGDASYVILTEKTSNPTYALIEIDKDSYYLTLTYSKDFLNKTEMGHNISPTIQLRHPKTKVEFETYSDLKIVCNSAPPAVYGPIVYLDESQNKYVLLFNMPKNDDLKGIHKDISHLYIKSTGYGKNQDFEYKYKVAVDDNGYFTLSKDSQSIPDTSKGIPQDNNITPTGAVFTPGDNPVYIPLNQGLTTNEVLYTFTLADNWNLKSTPAEASISSKKLAEPYFTDSKDILISNDTKIAQDTKSSFATFNLYPALRTYWFEDQSTGIIQNKYYVNGEAKNFEFDETKIDETSLPDNVDLLKDELPDSARVKINGVQTTDLASTKEAINTKWKSKNANTSKCTIEYSVSQIQDETDADGNEITTPLFSSSFDCEESSGSHPQKQKLTNQSSRLNNSGNTLKSTGHYTPVELPGGKLRLTVYTHKVGFADSNPVTYDFEVLRTRVYVSDKIDSNDETNNGSSNSHFKTITHAAKKLSTKGDSANTIYLDSDLTDNIVIPDGTYVNITPTAGTRTITAGTDDTEGKVLKIGDNATVVLQNLILQEGDIEVGENSKLYLNDVKFIGKTVSKYDERNKIHVASTGIVILGGNTIIDSEDITVETDELDEEGNKKSVQTAKTYIALEEGGKVQLGNKDINTPSKEYTAKELVVLQTVNENPTLNTILLETEYTSNTQYRPLQLSYKDIYDDLTSENDPYKLFKLNNAGYYIGFDEALTGSATAGRGLVKIPAVNITEPEVGGFTVILSVNQNEATNLETIKNNDKITFTLKRNGQLFTKATGLKLELRLEGDVIENSKNNQQSVQELTVPTTYPSGYYTIYAYFTYDGITYCEHFNVYMEAE
jgi:hypothetical protein